MRFGAVVLYTPAFIVPSLFIAIAGGWLGNIYIRAQLSVKREMSNAKAPVLGIVGGAISGLSKLLSVVIVVYPLTTLLHISLHSSLRCTRCIPPRDIQTSELLCACGQGFLESESVSTSNQDTAPLLMHHVSWVSVRIDAFAAIFSSSLAFYLVYGGRGYTPSNIGFVLNMASE